MEPCSACILLPDCCTASALADDEASRVCAALTVAALLLLFAEEASVSLELATPQLVAPATLLGAKIMRDQPDLLCLRNFSLIRGDGVEVVNSCGVQPVTEDVVAVAAAESEVQLSLLPLGLAAYGES